MYRITSYYHQQESFRSTPHSGIDFALNYNEPIRTIKDGVIEQITHYKENIGNGVLVKWDDGKISIYGHMSKVADNLHVGERVNAGELLGYAGSSGSSTGVHLHFGLKENGKFIDPSPYINDIQQMNIKQFVQHTQEPSQVKINFFDYMHEHMNAIGQLKINFISSLTNDSFFIQISKQLLQFVSSHSSFLNDIIACII